jgi:hypothetical protein
MTGQPGDFLKYWAGQTISTLDAERYLPPEAKGAVRGALA